MLNYHQFNHSILFVSKCSFLLILIHLRVFFSFTFNVNKIFIIISDQFGAPDKLKIVDFQITQYESLMHDLIFFLLTSVETSLVEDHFYVLLSCYYSEFIKCLERTKCKTDEYSFEK